LLLFAGIRPASAGELQVNGGEFHVYGELIAATLTVRENSSLCGSGTVRATSRIDGTVSPGAGALSDIGTLRFDGPLTFSDGSIFRCHALTHTALDRVETAYPVAGTCTVYVSKSPAAVPLQRAIVSGGAGSIYDGFSAPSRGGTLLWELTVGRSWSLRLTDLTGDSDGDGSPDWWEDEYFGGRTACVAWHDTDGDGLTDGGEEIAGTHPKNPTSVLRMIAIEHRAPNEAIVRWRSENDRFYRVLRGTDPVTGLDTPLAATVAADPPMNVYTDKTASGETYWYKVKARKTSGSGSR